MKLEQTDNITAMAIDFLYTVQNNEVIFSVLFIKMFNNDQTVIYEPSARRHFSRMSALFEARVTGVNASFGRMCRIHLRGSRFVQYFLKRTLAFLNYYSICFQFSLCRSF
jgi:hypothetical protein